MDHIEHEYWCIKGTNAEIEQEARTFEKEFWNLKLEALKDEIAKGKSHTANSKEDIPDAEDLVCMECEYSMLPTTAEICQNCQNHSNFKSKQGK